MSLTEMVCFTTVGVVACFGIISIALFEGALHDLRTLEDRQDRLETRIYVLEKCKFFHDYLRDNGGDDGQTAKEDPTVQI